MSSIRITGLVILLFGIAMLSIFENEMVEIVAAIIIGLGIGVALTGRYENK